MASRGWSIAPRRHRKPPVSTHPKGPPNAGSLHVNLPATGVMLLVESCFAGFTRKPVADARASSETLLALSLDSRAEVHQFMAKALAAGATPTIDAKDYGCMYQHGFADPDGHQREVFWMDEA